MSDQQSPVEDGKSPVAGPARRELSIGTKFGIMALIGVMALGFIWFNALYSDKSRPSQQTQEADYTNGGEQYAAPPPAPSKPVPVTLPQPAAQTTSYVGTGSQQSPASAPIMAYSGSDEVASPAPASTPIVLETGTSGQSGGAQGTFGPDNSPLAARLKPTLLDGEKASVLQNPDMVITEGTMIPCVLQTAIDSQLPGLVTCVVPTDIRGTTGNVVLLDGVPESSARSRMGFCRDRTVYSSIGRVPRRRIMS